MLKPLDILVALKRATYQDRQSADQEGWRAPTFEALGDSLGVSASQAYVASKNGVRANILRSNYEVKVRALLEVLAAIKYYVPAKLGEPTEGTPTSYAAKVLMPDIAYSPHEIPVWPTEGKGQRGLAVEPLYKTAPFAAQNDEKLYALLALVDALRIGRAREVSLAHRELAERLGGSS